ncbi:2-amino-4-hydroxy-6-hydroxymethyldihydropteridine diphosphokinase [Longirhabdus pacifica]|uniref:2-amino-4-hydroxy-6- hydroxymethyldihydropteridine diphosphokinase n=1 Tax=Longirhabdus pacifica TaxID=2305227 RepID=UPI0010093564|nr:2-amino-4-hydroxy-6-hydroxymethyldihydropteridine diphosphokinase [Longirhabdus pacifica]
MKHIVYIGAGSNIGDRKHHLVSAMKRLHEHPSIIMNKGSSLYESAPVGYTDQPAFLNMVAEIKTNLTPEQLLQEVAAIEHLLGRVRDIKWGPRTLDLDILLFDHVQMHSDTLTIPHPRMRERSFVMIPLKEILPVPSPHLEWVGETLGKLNKMEDVTLYEKMNWMHEFSLL